MSTLWGSYGRSKEWCPSRCPSAAPRFDCAGSHRVPFVTTVCGRSGGAGFWKHCILPRQNAKNKKSQVKHIQKQHARKQNRHETCISDKIPMKKIANSAGPFRHPPPRFTGCPCTFWSKTWFYVTGAGDRMVLEVRNVSLRGRCKESDTLWKSWQAQYFVDVAKTLAGVCHSKDCALCGRRRESAPWMLCFEVEGLDSWEGLHFWNLNLRISLRGQCSISYDLRSWFRGRRSTFETCFHFRGSLAQNARFGAPDIFSFRGSLAQNARFGAPDSQFSRKSRTKRSFWSSGSSVFGEVSHKTFVLELRIFSYRGSLAQNARFGAPDLQFSRKSRRKRSFWSSGFSVFEEVSHKTLVYKILMQVVQKGPVTEILRQRSCRSGPTGISGLIGSW